MVKEAKPRSSLSSSSSGNFSDDMDEEETSQRSLADKIKSSETETKSIK